jgi:hypothetical protein
VKRIAPLPALPTAGDFIYRAFCSIRVSSRIAFARLRLRGLKFSHSNSVPSNYEHILECRQTVRNHHHLERSQLSHVSCERHLRTFIGVCPKLPLPTLDRLRVAEYVLKKRARLVTRGIQGDRDSVGIASVRILHRDGSGVKHSNNSYRRFSRTLHCDPGLDQLTWRYDSLPGSPVRIFCSVADIGFPNRREAASLRRWERSSEFRSA